MADRAGQEWERDVVSFLRETVDHFAGTDAPIGLRAQRLLIEYLERADEWPDPKDLQIDTFRGGKTAVRITHLPTGLTAMSDDSDSVIKAREQALERLREAHRG